MPYRSPWSVRELFMLAVTIAAVVFCLYVIITCTLGVTLWVPK
jgi:uncharacterized iron-regulated membrane protein